MRYPSKQTGRRDIYNLITEKETNLVDALSMSKMVDQGSQMAGNWERRRPEEGGGWETLYDKDGFCVLLQPLYWRANIQYA